MPPTAPATPLPTIAPPPAAAAAAAEDDQRHAQARARADAEHERVGERVAEQRLHQQPGDRERRAGEHRGRGLRQPQIEHDALPRRLGGAAAEQDVGGGAEGDAHRAGGDVGDEEDDEEQRQRDGEENAARARVHDRGIIGLARDGPARRRRRSPTFRGFAVSA